MEGNGLNLDEALVGKLRRIQGSGSAGHHRHVPGVHDRSVRPGAAPMYSVVGTPDAEARVPRRSPAPARTASVQQPAVSHGRDGAASTRVSISTGSTRTGSCRCPATMAGLRHTGSAERLLDAPMPDAGMPDAADPPILRSPILIPRSPPEDPGIRGIPGIQGSLRGGIPGIPGPSWTPCGRDQRVVQNVV